MGNSVNSKVKEQFGREAQKYVHSSVHADPEDLNFVLEFINPQPSWQALDIATGGGHLALTLASKVKNVIATDLTEQMLEQVSLQIKSKNIVNIETKEEDVHDLSFDSEEFDLVGTRIAPHHFYDISKAMREIKRVTKKGWFIFIQDTLAPENPNARDFFNNIEKMRDPSHVRDLSESEWIDLFHNVGLTLIKHEKRQKSWQLKSWTERTSTPKNVVQEITNLLEDNKNQFRYSIKIEKDENNELVIKPFSGYFLVQKDLEADLFKDFQFNRI